MISNKYSISVTSSSQSSDSTKADPPEQSPMLKPRMTRGSALIALTPGSVLAKRITYSKFFVTVPTRPQLSACSQSSTGEEPDPVLSKTGRFLPRIINPGSSFSKRHAYSLEPKGTSDALSQNMRNYFMNTSMIETWLMQRMVKDVKERVDKRLSSSLLSLESSPSRNSSILDPRSVLAKRLVYASQPKDNKDSLLLTTRKYFLHESQSQTWSEERIVRAIYAEINRKFGGPSVLTATLQPPKEFIIELLYLTMPGKTTIEELFQLVEDKWIKPRYVHYRKHYIESLMFSGIFHKKCTCNHECFADDKMTLI